MPVVAEQTKLTVGEQDYPALYLSADSASRVAQSRHLRFTAVILGTLVASAAFGTCSGLFPPAAKVLALLSGAGAAISFMVTSIRKAMKPEKLWYTGRAVAEGAKSMAWRYMTGVEPYQLSLPPAEVDRKFIEDLRSMAEDQAQAALGLGGEFSDRPQITPRMREVRAAPLAQRLQTYRNARIRDQREWYGSKARKSQAVANRYFVVIQASQALTLAATVLLLSSLGSKWNLGGVFSALASALIAWLQVRQHEELAQTYTVAALDLGFIEAQSESVDTEQELSATVNDTENALGREHSSWIVRRTE
jgi:hypothetical protein